MMYQLLMVTLILYSSYGNAQRGGCSISPRWGVPHLKQPLYLSGRKLAEPELVGSNSSVRVQSGKAIGFACPGRGNSVEGGSWLEEGVCVSGSTFLLGGTPVPVNDITCHRAVKASLVETDENCAYSGSYVIEAGFWIDDDWLRLYDMCYNQGEGRTVFSHHVVSSQLVTGNEKNSKRPNFVKGLDHLFPDYDPDGLYKKTTQENIFRELLPNADYLDMTKTFLNKGHLAPDGDFMLTNWQHATYFYLNVAPQWSSINGGNWLALESRVRYLAANAGVDLEVWTGASGLLQLPDTEELVDINLGPIPVPLYFWKVVQRPDTREAMAFVVENDPYNVVARPPPCKSACPNNGWMFQDSILKGRVFCCPISEKLRRLIPGIPRVQPSGVLKFTQ